MASESPSYNVRDFLTIVFSESAVPIRHLAYTYVNYKFHSTGVFQRKLETLFDVKSDVFEALRRYYFITPNMYLELFKAAVDGIIGLYSSLG